MYFRLAGLALIGWRAGEGSRDEAAERGLKSWTEEAAQRVIGPAGIPLEGPRVSGAPCRMPSATALGDGGRKPTEAENPQRQIWWKLLAV